MPVFRPLIERAFIAVVFVAGYALLFRRWLFSGFDGIFGDHGDGEILIALVEHWRRVFAGLTWWSDPSFFFPLRGTLGYSDGYFLYGVARAALHALGFDAFTSLMLLMSALAAAGYFGFLHLARRHFAIPPAWAAVGAALFAFANMNAVKLVQAQGYAVMLLPLLCALALAAWAGRRAVVCAALAGLLHALIFFTAFQTAWFFTALLILFALLHPLVFGLARTRELLREAFGQKRQVLIAYGAAFAAGLVPFLALYLPVWISGRSRDWAEVLANAPDWRDILNVTPGNWLWGEALRQLAITGRPNRPVWEVELGFTPAVLAVFAVALFALMRRAGALAERERWLLLFGLGALALWLAELDWFGLRPWAAVWAAVPGAGAVRYIFRSQLVVNLFVALIVAGALAGLAAVWRGRAAALLAALLLVEQVNVEWPATISRRATAQWLAAIPPPPAPCRAFYLVPNAAPADKPGWEHQADAMLIAQLRDIATVNGYSSWVPKDWDLEQPAQPGYAAAVRDWAGRNGIGGELCGLDPANRRWIAGLPP